MSNLEEEIREKRDSLETLANADCSSSYIARILLDEIEGDSSNRQTKTTENESMAPEEPVSAGDSQESTVKDSVFAY